MFVLCPDCVSDLTFPESWDDGAAAGRVSLVAYAADLNLTGRLHAAGETQQGGDSTRKRSCSNRWDQIYRLLQYLTLRWVLS